MILSELYLITDGKGVKYMANDKTSQKMCINEIDALLNSLDTYKNVI